MCSYLYKTIPLASGELVLVDADDYPLLSANKWRKHEYGYALTGVGSNRRRMHRLIMGLNKGDVAQVDHINGDILDNRKSNLRLCNHSQNRMNMHRKATGTSSRYKGVTWSKRYNKWEVRARVDGKHKFIGYFNCESEAALAYNKEAIQSYGEFARPNIVVSV